MTFLQLLLIYLSKMFEVKLSVRSSCNTSTVDRDVTFIEKLSTTPIDASKERVKKAPKTAEILKSSTADMKAIAITSDFPLKFQIKIKKLNNQRKLGEYLSQQGNFHVNPVGISAVSMDLEVGREGAISTSTVEKSENIELNDLYDMNFNDIDIESPVPLFLKTSYHRVITICKEILEYGDEKEKSINGCSHEASDKEEVSKLKDFSALSDLNCLKENPQSMHGRKNRNCSWGGVHSLLITGHEGAGKSYLLNIIEKTLKSSCHIRNKSGHRNIRILNLSAKKSEYAALPRSTSASTPSFISFNCTSSSLPSSLKYSKKIGDNTNEEYSYNYERNCRKRKETRFHLQNFIQLLNTEKQRHENSFADFLNEGIEKKLNVILLIDDLDSLLLPYVKNENDNMGSFGDDDGDENSVCAAAAFHLRQLLILLAIPHDNDGDGRDQIAIIGATRLSPVSLPRANVGTSICQLPVPRVFCELYSSLQNLEGQIISGTPYRRTA